MTRSPGAKRSSSGRVRKYGAALTKISTSPRAPRARTASSVAACRPRGRPRLRGAVRERRLVARVGDRRRPPQLVQLLGVLDGLQLGEQLRRVDQPRVRQPRAQLLEVAGRDDVAQADDADGLRRRAVVGHRGRHSGGQVVVLAVEVALARDPHVLEPREPRACHASATVGTTSAASPSGPITE